MNSNDKNFSALRIKTAGNARRKNAGGTLLGLFIGLVIGLLIAFGVTWYINKAPLPFQNKTEAVPGTANEKTTEATTEPAPLPGKPGDKPREKQRFEFYGILEGKQQATPGSEPGAVVVTPAAPASGAASPTPTEAKSAALFFLQAGAFQKVQDADNLKAKLALMGLEASVQEVTVADKGTMQRVRVGPFHSPEEMNRARTSLAQAGVQATVVKQKE